jgi:predicted nucleic acid-binding protein
MMCVDTDVMIDILRRYEPAMAWLRSLGSEELALPGLVAMELLQGCRNRTEQRRVDRTLRPYRLYWPTQADCERAFQDYATFHLSHQLGILDALIAETAVGLGVALATFNEKHYRVVPTLQTLQPYERR